MNKNGWLPLVTEKTNKGAGDGYQTSLKMPWFNIVLTLEVCKSCTKIKHTGKKSKGTTYQMKYDNTV